MFGAQNKYRLSDGNKLGQQQQQSLQRSFVGEFTVNDEIDEQIERLFLNSDDAVIVLQDTSGARHRPSSRQRLLIDDVRRREQQQQQQAAFQYNVIQQRAVQSGRRSRSLTREQDLQPRGLQVIGEDNRVVTYEEEDIYPIGAKGGRVGDKPSQHPQHQSTGAATVSNGGVGVAFGIGKMPPKGLAFHSSQTLFPSRDWRVSYEEELKTLRRKPVVGDKLLVDNGDTRSVIGGATIGAKAPLPKARYAFELATDNPQTQQQQVSSQVTQDNNTVVQNMHRQQDYEVPAARQSGKARDREREKEREAQARTMQQQKQQQQSMPSYTLKRQVVGEGQVIDSSTTTMPAATTVQQTSQQLSPTFQNGAVNPMRPMVLPLPGETEDKHHQHHSHYLQQEQQQQQQYLRHHGDHKHQQPHNHSDHKQPHHHGDHRHHHHHHQTNKHVDHSKSFPPNDKGFNNIKYATNSNTTKALFNDLHKGSSLDSVALQATKLTLNSQAERKYRDDTAQIVVGTLGSQAAFATPRSKVTLPAPVLLPNKHLSNQHLGNNSQAQFDNTKVKVSLKETFI